MNKNIKIIIGITILLILMFFVGKCSNSPETIIKTITLPAIKGNSDTIYKPISNTKIIKNNYIYKDSVIAHDKEFDKEMVDRFSKLNSEYEKIKSYIECSEINTYQVPIEDSIIKSTINVKVRGELVFLQRDYILKERKIDVDIKVPKTVFKMNAGVGLITSTNLDKLTPTANILLTNYKGNTLIFQAGLDKSIQVGISMKIFEIKR